MSRTLRAWGAILALVLHLAAGPAFAQTAEQLAGFAKDSFSETEKALADLAAGGGPRALAIVEALRDGKLVASPSTQRVFVKTDAGAILDAANGVAVSDAPVDAAQVRLNNRLRRAVDQAIGSLTMTAPDPARRLAAAKSVMKAR
ncbi:MAG: urea ABC transporter permease subunit UrtB, partial [Methylobacteriaceae bacterium]|nr:urea ABC transporter permease subunit UrtB [Methylobacteriaceae bacterium]